MDTTARPVERRRPGGAYLKYSLHALVLIGLAIVGMKYIQGDLFWRAIHRFNWIYAPIVLALTVAYVLTKGWRFVEMMREFTDVGRWTLMKAYVAGQACSLVPGGMAARAGILKQVGIPPAATAAPIVVSSLSDMVFFIGVSIVAALWFEPVRKPVLFILGALTIVSVILGIEASRKWLLQIVERLMGRFRLMSHWRQFIASMRDVLTPAHIGGALADSAIAFTLMIGAMYLCARGVDAEVSLLTLMLAYTLPSLLGRISAMPGGVGLTEAGMISILNGAPGVSLDQAAAATTIFRLGTVVFAAAFGGIIYLLAWRGREEATE